MGKNRYFYLCALAGCFGFYVAYQEWFSWLLLVGLLGLPWLSLLVSLPAVLSFRAAANAPAVLTAGTEATVNIQGTARLAVPWFDGRLRLCRIPTGEEWRFKSSGHLPTEHCGAIRVIPERVWVCDALGLLRFRVRAPREALVTVRPQPVSMGEMPDLSRFLALRWRPKPGGGYAENHELRLYRPGDSLNQIHWKLTAKTGKLTIREAMEPDLGLVLVTLDICGTPEQLDRKFGRLLWLGTQLNDLTVPFEIRALTGEGVQSFPVKTEQQLTEAIDRLLQSPAVSEGSILDRAQTASWHRHLGGEPDGP